MSDIPKARAILSLGLREAVRIRNDNERARLMITAARRALLLMRRRRPKFIAEPELPPLMDWQKAYARKRRAQGASLHKIMQELKTNIGRVSEAVNS